MSNESPSSDASSAPRATAPSEREPPSGEPDGEFLAGVRDGSRPSLSHDDHLRLGWLVLREHTLLEAIPILARDLAAFATAKRQGAIYNETITWVFAALIHERLRDGRGGGDFAEFLALNPDLRAGMSVVQELYAPGTLDSALAREHFVLPDRDRTR